MNTFLRTIGALGLLAASTVYCQAEEIYLRAVSAFPPNLEFSKQFQVFIDRVNRNGKGVVSIQLVGGPEAIPVQQQDTAIRNGVFDIQMGPASYYNGVVPEADALFGATVGPVEARANGATALLNNIWRQKLNAEFIGWQSGGIPFYVYLVDAPRFTPDGLLDLSGIQMRSTPAYREWFERLGGNNVMLQTSEMFTAMERGIVRGVGWPAISFTDIGVHKFLKYRVAPPVWQLDLVIMMNASKWDTLPDDAKSIIALAAAEHEKATEADFLAIAEKEKKLLEDAGMQMINVTNPELHRKVAHDLVWERLEKRDPTNAAALREKLYTR